MRAGSPAGVCRPANAPTALDSQAGLGLEGISLAPDPVRRGERRSLRSLTHSGHPRAGNGQAWRGRQPPSHGPGQPSVFPSAHTPCQPLKLPKGPFSWRHCRAGGGWERRVIAFNKSSRSLCSRQDRTGGCASWCLETRPSSLPPGWAQRRLRPRGSQRPSWVPPPPAPSSSPLSSREGSAASSSGRSPPAGAQGSPGAGTWQDTGPQARVTRSPSAPGLFTVQGLGDSEG